MNQWSKNKFWVEYKPFTDWIELTCARRKHEKQCGNKDLYVYWKPCDHVSFMHLAILEKKINMKQKMLYLSQVEINKYFNKISTGSTAFNGISKNHYIQIDKQGSHSDSWYQFYFQNRIV